MTDLIRTWAEAAGITLHHGETLRTVRVEDLRQLVSAAAAVERERLRGCFDETLADHGITWPGEVDILYDQCFPASEGRA